jgi:hypothetical protein
MMINLQHTSWLILLLILFIQMVCSCATPRERFEIMEKTELPVYDGEPRSDPLKMRVLFHLMKDGSVSDVRVLSKSGDSNWDMALADSLKKWRFAMDSSDSSVWVSRNIIVHLQPSLLLNLGELTASTKKDADLLYSRLRAGVSFDQLVIEYTEDSTSDISGRYLKNINTSRYPIHVSRMLRELRTGEYSQPVEVYGRYIIFQRFGTQLPSD